MPEINAPARDTDGTSQTRTTVEKKALKPAGLLPKNTQQLVILGVAVVMVLIMWLTGNGKRPQQQRLAHLRPGCKHLTQRRCKILNNPFKRTKPLCVSRSLKLTWAGSRHWA